jgi:TonB-dependent starch-binding outer membrane protein SusC
MNLNSRKTTLIAGMYFFLLIGGVPSAFAISPVPVESTQQIVKVRGMVVDQYGEAIIGANILHKGTTNGVITDLDGNFALDVPNGAVLEISFVGYITQTVKVLKSDLKIVLVEDTRSLDEVVVVGYGVLKKKLITGATVQVSGDNLQKLSTTSALSAMQSQTPGVSITQSSGQPGEGFKVNIRGLGTTGTSSPLYVIDGVAGGDINNLNPSDIESIDVLKDAASAAIYGARAANGVILVTTKQGKSGKIQVSYDGYYGVQNVYKMPDLLDAKQYMSVINQVEFNDGISLTDWTSVMTADMYNSIMDGTWKGTNWLDAIRNEDAPMQNHSINMVGGSDISKFSLGVSYSSQEGILGKPVQSDYERTTVRLNSDHVIYKKNNTDVVKFGETLYYNYNTKSGIGIGNQYWNDISNMLRAYPIMPIYGDDGEYFDLADKKSTGLQNYQADAANPIASMVYQRGNNISKNHSLNMSAYLQIQPIKNLIFKSQFGYKFSSSSYRQFTPTYELSSTVLNSSNSVQQTGSQGWSYTFENTLAYKFNISEDHHFDALIGQSMEKSGMGESLGATNYNLLWNDLAHAWLDNTQGVSSTTTVTGSPWDEGSLASFFGRINYDYKERYMVSAVMRTDGSSNFARGHRWGYFPSVSAGWVISEEMFMEKTKAWMDYLKIRASWGQNGNCNIPNFQYLATVSFDDTAGYSFGNNKTTQSTGGYANLLPNEDISWETSEQLDFGFDARLLNSRLNIAFDWYNKKTKDWLVDAPILASYGTGAPYINGGDVENKGVELALGWNDHVSKDFTYGINLNIAHNKNEVTRIANAEGIIHGETNVLSQGTTEMYRAEVGKPIGYFWGYKTGGVFQNQAQIDQWTADEKPTLQTNPQSGDLIFVDTNGDSSIDENDKVEIGNPHPDFTMGLNLNLGYKGFDLSITANGAFGQQIAKSYRKFGDSYKDNYTTDVFNCWHGEGTSNKLPRLTAGNKTNWIEISDIYIEDADYVKIQNITLGYDFKKLFPLMALSQARLFVTAQNLFTITGYSGMDPEIGTSSNDTDYPWASGIDLGFYPSPRTFLVGVNLKF